MTTYVLAPLPRFGVSGTENYLLYTYASGTSTPINTWSDNGTTLNANPIVLSASGLATVYIIAGTSYRFVYKVSTDGATPGSTVFDADPVAVADPAAAGGTGTSGTSLTLTGDLTVEGNTTLEGDLTVTGDTILGGDLTITGDTISNGIKLTALPPGHRNGSLSAVASTNTIVFSYVTQAGATPSATDPVNMTRRNQTITTGTTHNIAQTAALTFTLSSGSTLGAGSSEAVRMHVLGIRNAGSAMELAVYTASVASSTGIKRFDPAELITTTAEGGAGAADSAQTVYSTTQRTSQPAIYLGYIEATSSATAGQWASVDKVVNWEPGVPMPGDVVGGEFKTTTAFASGTTVLPVDDTIPQITEGNQSMTQAYTAKSVMNWLEFTHNGQYSSDVHTDAGIAIALFDGSADALAAVYTAKEYGVAPDDNMGVGSLFHRTRAGSTSSKTYTTRYGGNTGTFSFNGFNGARMFGGVSASVLEIKEIHG